MSATDDLRRMLDGRGVKWMPINDSCTCWFMEVGYGTHDWFRVPVVYNGALHVDCVMSPTQAILTTLGVGECHDEGGIGSKYPAAFICSECGWSSTVFAFGGNMPQFCPECGRKVKR